ncbi:hypothetical protein KIL84_000669 [Mauremys mutica]|uniref:Uncharacterized protein n=1 Tax=Mauremys mutica TaxID=74926 RepID=A0A9D3WX11_9SAUR|nr:hypothetical protein KIL84_000669 [Mauremys mutica]
MAAEALALGTDGKVPPAVGLTGASWAGGWRAMAVSWERLNAKRPGVLVGEVNGQVVVTCDTPQEHVSWQQNGEPEIMAEHYVAGRTLTLEGLDQPAAGNYSCWQGPRLLDSTYVVVSDPEYPLLQGSPGACPGGGDRNSSSPGAPHPQSCLLPGRRAGGGGGERGGSARGVQAVGGGGHHPGGAPGAWVYVGGGAALQGPDRPQPFTVTLADGTFCPFAEEPRPLELALEGISAESFVNITRRLFLRDIVRPGPPQDVTAQSKGGRLHLSWAPPASWSSPYSYFLLRYQLEYKQRDGTTGSLQLEGVTETSVEGDVRWVQIRCQDPLVNSTWSPWTTWQKV